MADLNTRTFDWDDEIENEGSEFVILQPGEYFFEVKNFEKGTFPGSQKVPPCNKAILTLAIQDGNGRTLTTIKDDIFLCEATEWRISQFFISVGLKKHGERTKMRWNECIGTKGRVKIRQDKWEGRDGNEMISNRVDKYCDPADIPSLSVPSSSQPGAYEF